MQVRRIGMQRKMRLLPGRGLWICLLAGLFTVGGPQRLGVGASFAQSAPQQPSENTGNGAGAQTGLPDEANDAAGGLQNGDPQKTQIAQQSANLLKLANSLKAEVDKTTPDTLSVTVVREAAEIEKLAHQMRAK